MAGKKVEPETENAIKQFTTSTEFYLKAGLYEEFSYTTLGQAFSVEFFPDPIDTFCVDCKMPSTFREAMTPPEIINNNGGRRKASLALLASNVRGIFRDEEGDRLELQVSTYGERTRYRLIRFVCMRNYDHYIQFCLRLTKNTIEKIGQYPSIATIQSGEIKTYRKVLGNDKGAEFARALGLHSHGIGIGAFVYLRRIFEHLIGLAQDEAKVAGRLDEAAFGTSRMEDKIGMLHDYLPAFLVENKVLYGILSKGIHELSENECNSHFEVVRTGIELILDAKLAEKEQREKETAARKAIAGLNSKLKA